jgi:hypothetical protein
VFVVCEKIGKSLRELGKNNHNHRLFCVCVLGLSNTFGVSSRVPINQYQYSHTHTKYLDICDIFRYQYVRRLLFWWKIIVRNQSGNLGKNTCEKSQFEDEI